MLKQIFLEEMAHLATPDIMFRTLAGLQQKLAAEAAGQSLYRNKVDANQNMGQGHDLSVGYKVAIYATAITVCTSILVGISNFYRTRSDPPYDQIERQEDDFLTELRSIVTETDLIRFRHKWDIPYSAECVDENGIVYSVSAKTIEDKQYFIGYKALDDVFLFVWEEVEPDRLLPEDQEVIIWIESRLRDEGGGGESIHIT
ncbi:MAG: hypothetical protein FWH28_01375 [Clostridiales bacterium]|nr:hypothetical protein [Clostridiales bacterium]